MASHSMSSRSSRGTCEVAARVGARALERWLLRPRLARGAARGAAGAAAAAAVCEPPLHELRLELLQHPVAGKTVRVGGGCSMLLPVHAHMSR